MGCVFPKHEERNQSDLSLNTQRNISLRFVRQNSKYVRNPGYPDLRLDEQNDILLSMAKYFQFISSPNKINHFSEMMAKHPIIISSYFSELDPDTQDIPEMDDIENDVNYQRHILMSKTVINNCIQKLASGETEDVLESLRRIGSLHAENWVCSKDLLLFEDSFMCSLDEFDPDLDQKVKASWRKMIRFIVYNMMIGINVHYEKMNFVIHGERLKLCCRDYWAPTGVDPRAYGSLRKLSAFVKEQAE